MAALHFWQRRVVELDSRLSQQSLENALGTCEVMWGLKEARGLRAIYLQGSPDCKEHARHPAHTATKLLIALIRGPPSRPADSQKGAALKMLSR
jgi:hypothetical protein